MYKISFNLVLCESIAFQFHFGVSGVQIGYKISFNLFLCESIAFQFHFGVSGVQIGYIVLKQCQNKTISVIELYRFDLN